MDLYGGCSIVLYVYRRVIKITEPANRGLYRLIWRKKNIEYPPLIDHFKVSKDLGGPPKSSISTAFLIMFPIPKLVVYMWYPQFYVHPRKKKTSYGRSHHVIHVSWVNRPFFNGHFRILNWRYQPYIRPIF